MIAPAAPAPSETSSSVNMPVISSLRWSKVTTSTQSRLIFGKTVRRSPLISKINAKEKVTMPIKTTIASQLPMISRWSLPFLCSLPGVPYVATTKGTSLSVTSSRKRYSSELKSSRYHGGQCSQQADGYAAADHRAGLGVILAQTFGSDEPRRKGRQQQQELTQADDIVTTSRSWKAAIMPTAPVNRMKAPDSNPKVRTVREFSDLSIFMTRLLGLGLRQAFAEDALRAENQHQHQHGEGDDVFQLVRARDAQTGQHQVGSDGFNHAEETRPPSMAPGILPMPPKTAAVKALMPGMKPI